MSENTQNLNTRKTKSGSNHPKMFEQMIYKRIIKFRQCFNTRVLLNATENESDVRDKKNKTEQS